MDFDRGGADDDLDAETFDNDELPPWARPPTWAQVRQWLAMVNMCAGYCGRGLDLNARG